jgi:hypothetical protein
MREQIALKQFEEQPAVARASLKSRLIAGWTRRRHVGASCLGIAALLRDRIVTRKSGSSGKPANGAHHS